MKEYHSISKNSQIQFGNIAQMMVQQCDMHKEHAKEYQRIEGKTDALASELQSFKTTIRVQKDDAAPEGSTQGDDDWQSVEDGEESASSACAAKLDIIRGHQSAPLLCAGEAAACLEKRGQSMSFTA